MSMTLCAVVGDVVIAASDRRRNNLEQGTHNDCGGKLIRLNDAWVTVTGSADIGLRGLRALAANDTTTFLHLAGEAAVLDREGLDGHSTFTIAADDATLRVIEVGAAHGVHDNGTCAIRFPPDIPPDQHKVVTQRFVDAALNVSCLTDIFRAISAAFAAVAEHSTLMSPSIEIGATFDRRLFYLIADSRTLPRMPDTAIVCLLSDPPTGAALQGAN